MVHGFLAAASEELIKLAMRRSGCHAALVLYNFDEEGISQRPQTLRPDTSSVDNMFTSGPEISNPDSQPSPVTGVFGYRSPIKPAQSSYTPTSRLSLSRKQASTQVHHDGILCFRQLSAFSLRGTFPTPVETLAGHNSRKCIRLKHSQDQDVLRNSIADTLLNIPVGEMVSQSIPLCHGVTIFIELLWFKGRGYQDRSKLAMQWLRSSSKQIETVLNRLLGNLVISFYAKRYNQIFELVRHLSKMTSLQEALFCVGNFAANIVSAQKVNVYNSQTCAQDFENISGSDERKRILGCAITTQSTMRATNMKCPQGNIRSILVVPILDASSNVKFILEAINRRGSFQRGTRHSMEDPDSPHGYEPTQDNLSQEAVWNFTIDDERVLCEAARQVIPVLSILEDFIVLKNSQVALRLALNTLREIASDPTPVQFFDRVVQVVAGLVPESVASLYVAVPGERCLALVATNDESEDAKCPKDGK